MKPAGDLAGSFLFATWSGGGNTQPLGALALRLRERGHSVRVFAAPELQLHFEALGLPFKAHRSRSELSAGLAREAANAVVLQGVVTDFLAEVDLARPDVMVVDYMMPELLSASEAAGCSTVALVHTLYTRVALGPKSPMGMSGGVSAINALRRGLGLDEVPTLPALLARCACVLVATAQELDDPELPLPANVRFTGPIRWHEPGPPAAIPSFAEDLPLVHVSMGTVAPDEMTVPILQSVLAGLAGSPVNVLVTLPRQADQPWASKPPAGADAFEIPPNAVVVPYLPHEQVLPQTAVFVTHAGLGSVGAALTFGVPMVCIPIFLEQPDNAAAVERLGAGKVLDRSASPSDIRAAVEDVLANPAFGREAQRVADALRAAGSGHTSVEALESLLAQNRDVPRVSVPPRTVD